MTSLIDRAEEAANKVKNQEIIFLMGQTGAGKSTTVYFLAG
jgi:flagellar biosynthesis GTPase FlhF